MGRAGLFPAPVRDGHLGKRNANYFLRVQSDWSDCADGKLGHCRRRSPASRSGAPQRVCGHDSILNRVPAAPLRQRVSRRVSRVWSLPGASVSYIWFTMADRIFDLLFVLPAMVQPANYAPRDNKVFHAEHAPCPQSPCFKILPWAAFSFASLASLIVGLARPDRVTLSRNFFYCSVSPPVGYISEAFCGLVMAASVIIQVHIGYTLIYGWRARTLRRDLLPVGSIVRLSIFSVYATTSVIVVIIMLRFPDANTPRYPFILMSAFPLVGWIIFWTQRDILEIWICRRRKGAREQPSGDRDTLSAAGDTTPEDYVKSSKVDDYA